MQNEPHMAAKVCHLVEKQSKIKEIKLIFFLCAQKKIFKKYYLLLLYF